MHRFFVSSAASPENEFFLSEEDTRHALKVLRLQTGDEVEIFSDSDRFLAEITEIKENRILVRPLSRLSDTEPKLKITLFQGLPKSDKMDWIVQKATELGVSRIVPVRMSRCVVKMDAKDAERKRERWMRIAREACKQSGCCIVPEIASPLSVPDLSGAIRDLSLCVVPWEDCSAGGPLSIVRNHPDLASLGIIIGPEGGITPDEILRLQESGCVPITLGKRILRTETAGLCAVSAFMALLEELEG